MKTIWEKNWPRSKDVYLTNPSNHLWKLSTTYCTVMSSSCRAASSGHRGCQRNRLPGLPRRPHLPRCQHCHLQSHLAKRRPRCSSGPTGARPDQPLAAGVGCDARSRGLVRVHCYERRRCWCRENLPDCARWACLRRSLWCKTSFFSCNVVFLLPLYCMYCCFHQLLTINHPNAL